MSGIHELQSQAGASRFAGVGASSAADVPRGTASAADAADFRSRLAEREDAAEEKAGGSRQDETSKDEDALGPLFRFSSVEDELASLFKDMQRMSDLRTNAAADAPPASAAGATGDDALEALISRILVGRPEAGGAEVRIQIDEKFLPGTEITLTRGKDGLLFVRITAENVSSYQTVVAARNELADRLAATEKGPVVVSVSTGAEAEGNDARRESRGRFDDGFDRSEG